MAKKNKLAKVKNLECLNCGYPFFGNEIYCPECGQKNKNESINFGSFLKEMFNGFTSWDAKFWKTLLPLLTKPGKVSKDYIQGKRARYTNPFRFYLTTSILFFLLFGLGNFINDYREFNSDKTLNTDIDVGVVKVNTQNKDKNSINSDIIDGWNSYSNENTNTHSYKKGILDAIEDNKKDTVTSATIFGKNITDYVSFQKKYPNLPIHQALDSLKEPKTIINRLLYKKAKTINGFSKNPKQSVTILINEATSHISTAIFILLPLFALFLKLLYFRRKYTYVEHLIFVFHTQTILFILLIVFGLVQFLFPNISSTVISNTTLILFLIYFFIAMKVFYEQAYLKTTIKYFITITAYSLIALAGTSVVTIVAFIMMK